MPEFETRAVASYGGPAAQVQPPTGEAGFLPLVDLPAGLTGAALPIGEMAVAFHVTHRTLHFYEEKGLLFSRRVGMMRIYDPWEIRRMAVITCCREVGMPILAIKDMMEELSDARSQAQADEIFYDAMMLRKRELVAGLSTVRRQMQQIITVTKADPTEGLAPINDNRSDEAGLSMADIQCLGLMARGYSVAQVAAAMAMPEETARAAEAAVIRKFNASNRFQAVAKAMLLGIIQEE